MPVRTDGSCLKSVFAFAHLPSVQCGKLARKKCEIIFFSTGLFLTKLSLMSRVLLLGRRWSSNSDNGEARWSSRVCNGWDWTETPVCAIIRLAITSRPLKLLGRFILFSLRVWGNNLQCFMVYPFFLLFSFFFLGENNHFWNFAIRREHFRDGCIEISQQTSTVADVSEAWMWNIGRVLKNHLKPKKENINHNDRLNSWWNPSGITQPLPPFFPSTKVRKCQSKISFSCLGL